MQDYKSVAILVQVVVAFVCHIADRVSRNFITAMLLSPVAMKAMKAKWATLKAMHAMRAAMKAMKAQRKAMNAQRKAIRAAMKAAMEAMKLMMAMKAGKAKKAKEARVELPAMIDAVIDDRTDGEDANIEEMLDELDEKYEEAVRLLYDGSDIETLCGSSR